MINPTHQHATSVSTSLCFLVTLNKGLLITLYVVLIRKCTAVGKKINFHKPKRKPASLLQSSWVFFRLAQHPIVPSVTLCMFHNKCFEPERWYVHLPYSYESRALRHLGFCGNFLNRLTFTQRMGYVRGRLTSAEQELIFHVG